MAMTNIISNSAQALTNVAKTAAKYMPEPAVRGVGIFKDVMNAVTNVGGSTVGGVPGDVFGDFESLINKQIEIQREFQSTAMVSNIEKSRHESKMSAIRNIRVSLKNKKNNKTLREKKMADNIPEINRGNIETKKFADDVQDMFLNLNTTTMQRVEMLQKHMKDGELTPSQVQNTSSI